MPTSRLISRLTEQALAAESDYEKLGRLSQGDIPEAAANILGERHSAALSGLAAVQADTFEQMYDKARALEGCVRGRKGDVPEIIDDRGLAASLVRDILRNAPRS